MFKRISLLIVFSLIAGVAFAGAAGLVPIPREEIVFLPGSHNLKDSTGELSAGTIARTSDDMLPDGSGWARGDRDQLIGTSDQNDDTNWPLTIAVDAGSVYILSTDTSGATVTVAEDTATLDATGSATYGAANAFSFRCTAGGDITLSVSGSSTPRAMLEEVPSDLALGAELVTNGTFDSDITGWSDYASRLNTLEWSSGRVHAVESDGDWTHLETGDDISLVAGSAYKLSYDYEYISGAGLTAIIQAGATVSDARHTFSINTSTDTYQYIFVAETTEDATLKFVSQGSTEYYLDNVSIKEVPLSVWTDALGPELIESAGQNPTDTDSYWSKANCSLNSDGGLVGTAGEIQHRIEKTNLLSASTTYIFSCKAKEGFVNSVVLHHQDDTGDENSKFNLNTGVVSSPDARHSASISSTAEADGYYTVSIVFTTGTVSTNKLRIGGSDGTDFTYVGGVTTPDIYIKDISLKELGDFHIQPSPYTNASTIPAEGVYLDGWNYIQNATVLNLLPYSNDISEFTVTRTTVEPDAVLLPTGDYGGNNFLKEDNTAANTHYTYYDISGIEDSTTHMASGFAKANGRTWIKVECRSKDNTTDRAHFQLSGSGAVGTIGGGVGAGEAGIYAVGSNGWYRWWMLYETATGATTPRLKIELAEADNDVTFDGDNTSGVYLWCLNLTEGSALYRPIPTNGVPAYTTPETVSVALSTGLKDILDDSGTYGTTTSEGTMIVEITPGYAYTDLSGDVPIISLNSGAEFLYVDNAGNVETTDGTNTANVDIDFANGDELIVAITWSKTGDSIRIGIKESGSWTWDSSSAAYEDKWALGANIVFGDSNEFPYSWRNLRFFRRALPTDIIEANF
jgi:hypothetical protein